MNDPLERVMQRPAADYVAGDLDPAQAEQFSQALADDPDLQTEVAFWETMRRELPQAGRPPAVRGPGPGLAAAVRRRAEADQAAPTEPRRQPLRLWTTLAISGWAVAAAALAAAFLPNVFTNSPASGSVFLGYNEHGQSVMISNQQPVERRLISNRVSDNGVNTDWGPATSHSPWLGIWTEPVDLQGFDRDRGLLVRHVEAQSAAASIGLIAGDILIEFGKCEMYTRSCISHAMDSSGLSIGDRTPVSFISSRSGELVQTEITIGQ